MTTIISRKAWGADRLGNQFQRMTDIYGVTIHWNGPGMGNYTHGSCDDRIRGMQSFHIHGNGWNDIGYNFIVCRHGDIYEGRGLHAVGAHAGESHIGGNSHWYGVQAMIGTGDTITPELLLGLDRAVKYCRSNGDAGSRVNGHRNHHSTDCPGDKLYAWVQKGMPLGVAPKPPLPVPTEEDMDYSSFGNSDKSPTEVPANEWTDVQFDTEYADPTNGHGSTGPTVLLGSRQYTLNASVEFRQSDMGDLSDNVVQMRVAEFKYVPASGDKKAIDELVEQGDPQNTILERDQKASLTAVGHVNDGRKLRVQVRHHLVGPATIVGARCTILSQNAGSK